MAVVHISCEWKDGEWRELWGVSGGDAETVARTKEYAALMARSAARRCGGAYSVEVRDQGINADGHAIGTVIVRSLDV